MKALSHQKNKIKSIACAILCVLLLCIASIGGYRAVFAAAPTIGIGFQGQLFNAGEPVDDSVSATFKFYDALAGGSQQGSTINQTVTVVNGYFAATFTESDLSGIDFNQSLWLEVTVEGNTLTPRSAANTVPFANKAFGAFSFSAAPTVGPAGSLYYNSVSSTLLVSNGSSWISVGSGSSATTTINGASGPAFSFATSSSGTDFSISTSTGTVTFNIPTASAVNRGLLSSADYLRIPSSASSTEWAAFFATPSTRITAGTGLSWSGNTLNATAATTTLLVGNGFLHTATSTDGIRAAYFTATSSTATSTFAGTVGIGTTTPGAKLDIWGNLRVGTSSIPALFVNTATSKVGIGTTTGTNTLTVAGTLSAEGMYGSFLRTSGDFAVGLELIGTGEKGGLYDLSTDSMIAVVNDGGQFFYGVDDVGTPSGGIVVDGPGGNVGIGTTIPTEQLTVAGNIALSPGANRTFGVAQSENSTNGFNLSLFAGDAGNTAEDPYNGGAVYIYGGSKTFAGTDGNVILGHTGSAARGNVGVGTTSPTSSFFIQGIGGTNPFAIASSTGASMLTLLQNGNVGIGTTTPISKLSIVGTAGSTSNIFTIASSSNSAYMVVTSAGNVGIGTTTPSSKIALAGGNFTHTALGNPTLKGTYNTTGNASGVFVSGKYAYVADTASGLHIIDISNPTAPILIGTYDTAGNAYNVFVSGKYAYVADDTAGLQIIDVSNPFAPFLVSTYNTTGNANGVYVSGKYAYVADSASGLQIIDISNPAAPSLTGTYNTSGSAFSVYTAGKYAYVGDFTAGLQIIDISNPVSPALIGTYNTPNFAGITYVSGKYAYVADTNTLQIIDISNPALLALAGSYTSASSVNGLYVSGKYAYLADAAAGLTIIDVSSSTAPILIGGYDTSGTADGVYVSGKYAYVADRASGLQIVDINGIETPALYAGNIEANVLNVTENIIAGGDIYAQGGLNIGMSGIFSRGTISAYVASSTQTNAVVANFMGGNVGIGSSTPTALFLIQGSSSAPTLTLMDVASSTGSSILRVTSNGRLGIGSSTPISTFSLVGTSGTNPFVIASSTGASMLTLNQLGNLGIGTTSARSALEVHSTDAVGLDPAIYLSNSTVSHGITGVAPDNVFAALRMNSVGHGGLQLVGLNESNNVGLEIIGIQGTSDPNDGQASLTISGKKLSGVNGSALGSLETVMQFLNNQTIMATFLGSGNLGIGQTAPALMLHVGSTAVTDATNLLRLQDADSTCDFNANASAPSCGSDETLKKNILSIDGNLDKVLALRPVSYNWNTDAEGVEAKIGFVAQEVGLVMPELVRDGTWIDGTTRKFLSTGGMIPYLVGAIKEQHLLIGDSTSSTAPMSEITLFIDNVQTEAPRTALSYIMQKVEGGMRPLTNFVSLRITAIRGYFDEIFSKKIHTEQICMKKSDGMEVCIDGDQLQNIISDSTDGTGSGDTGSGDAGGDDNATTSDDGSDDTIPVDTGDSGDVGDTDDIEGAPDESGSDDDVNEDAGEDPVPEPAPTPAPTESTPVPAPAPAE
jgi:hypothetical protein